MKTETQNIIEHEYHLGNGKFHINFLIREMQREDEGVLITYNEAETVKVVGIPTPESKFHAVVRSRYSDAQIERILSDRSMQSNMAEYVQYQGWRKIAEQVSQGVYSYTDLQLIADLQLYKVTLPLSLIVDGGALVSLRNWIMMQGLPYEVDSTNQVARVWLHTIYPADLQTLSGISSISIEQVNTYNL